MRCPFCAPDVIVRWSLANKKMYESCIFRTKASSCRAAMKRSLKKIAVFFFLGGGIVESVDTCCGTEVTRRFLLWNSSRDKGLKKICFFLSKNRNCNLDEQKSRGPGIQKTITHKLGTGHDLYHLDHLRSIYLSSWYACCSGPV